MMDSQASDSRIDQITGLILGCAYRVHNTLGVGFLENALAHEVRKAGLGVVQQAEIDVYCDRVRVGLYAADLLVESTVLVELKAVRALDNIHMAQCLNYLRATGLEVCLLLNFGTPRLQKKRVAR
jgi:GxxExxY protein